MTMIDGTRGLGGSDFVEGRQQWHLIGSAPLRPDRTVSPARRVDGSTWWLVTGYQQARDFLRDERFSRAIAAESVHPRGPALRMSITEMDRPRHTTIRKLVSKAFSTRSVERLRPRVERLAERLVLDAVAAAPEADLLADVAIPLTFGAHCELLGVPGNSQERIRRCAFDRLGDPGVLDPARTYQAELRLHHELSDLLADPALGEGLLADLVAAHRDGLLTETELTGLAASLFFDGYALSAAQIANVLFYLLTRPALRAAATDPCVADKVIEESLRHSPSVTLSMVRVATTDLMLGDTPIRAGDRVAAALPLANRDAEVFEQPCRFDPSRKPSRHLAFGHGTHHCVGAHLARTQLRSAVGALLRHAPDMELAVPEHELSWYVSPSIRSLNGLPVRWERQADPAVPPPRWAAHRRPGAAYSGRR